MGECSLHETNKVKHHILIACSVATIAVCVCVVVACAFVRHNQGILLFSTQNNQPHMHAVISLCRKARLLCVLFTLCDIIVTFNHPPPPCKHNFYANRKNALVRSTIMLKRLKQVKQRSWNRVTRTVTVMAWI